MCFSSVPAEGSSGAPWWFVYVTAPGAPRREQNRSDMNEDEGKFIVLRRLEELQRSLNRQENHILDLKKDGYIQTKLKHSDYKLEIP